MTTSPRVRAASSSASAPARRAVRVRNPSNPWSAAAIRRAQLPTYLDDLCEVYPLDEDQGMRTIPEEVWAEVQAARAAGDDARLLKALLSGEVPRWPGRDTRFLSFFRDDPEMIQPGSKAVSETVADVRVMDDDTLRERASAPISSSRQFGPKFRNWLGDRLPTTSDVEEFLAADGIMNLSLSDGALKGMAQEFLGYKGDKGLDACIKAGDRFILVEAKFIAAAGGSQNQQVSDALAIHGSLGTGSHPDVVTVAVVDGVYLRSSNEKAHKAIRSSAKPVVSALDLLAFVEHIAEGGDPRKLPA